jgi:hypothetical protein
MARIEVVVQKHSASGIIEPAGESGGPGQMELFARKSVSIELTPGQFVSAECDGFPDRQTRATIRSRGHEVR